MKKKELKEYQSKTVAEINKRIVELQEEKVKTILEVGMGKVKNVHASAKIKKEIAQLKTIANLKSRVSATKQKTDKGVENAD